MIVDPTLSRVLLITLSNIGDLVMTTPVLEGLHAAYPAARIDIVGDQRSSALLTHCPYRGEIFHRHKRDGWHGLAALVARLRRQRYDLVVDLRTLLLPLVLKCRRRVSKFGLRPVGRHAVEEHFAVVRKLLGREVPIPSPRVWTDVRLEERGRELLGEPAGGRWLAFAPGANWPGKIWPAAFFIELAARSARSYDALVVLGASADSDSAARIAAARVLPTVNLAGKTDLLEAAAVLGRATAFVGNDSGLGHIAAATGVPTLTVFGPGRPQRYHPWGPRACHLMAPDGNLAKLDPGVVAVHLARHVGQPA